MRYGPREGPINYTHPEFTPLYLDEQPTAVRQAAEKRCGSASLACVFDFIATGSAAFADASRQTKETADTDEEQRSKRRLIVSCFDSLLHSCENQLHKVAVPSFENCKLL